MTWSFASQGNGTGEARDMYVPNPSCKDFPKYEWIGQIMGAALRGKEFLVSFQPHPCMEVCLKRNC